MGERVIGIGLVGCGTNGWVHAHGLAALAAEGEIRAVAAADPSPDGLEAVNRQCAFDRLHPDGASVVSDPEVDAVLVTSPTATHSEIVRRAIALGKPVMCEKPLAPTFAEVASICADVAGSGVVGQVGFHSRFNPMFQHLRDLVVTGELGAPIGYMLREDQFWPTGAVVPGHSSWRSDRAQSGGGALLEHTIHGCDLLSWIFGAATSVTARTRSVFGFGVEDLAAATVEHGSGVIGTITTVFNGVQGREERRLEVFFERGTVEITGDFVIGAREDAMLIHRPATPTEVPDLVALRAAYFATLGITRDDLIFYQYIGDRAFVHGVRSGVLTGPGFPDAYAAHALVEAAYRSADAGGAPVRLADLPGSAG